jgi:hypothetical protein
LLTAGFATATPLVWHGSREYVQKKADKHDVDAFMGGALASAGAYQGLGYATHPWQYRQEKKFSPAAKARIDRHFADVFGTDKRGRPVKPGKGDPRYKKFGRTYPKTDARMKMGPVSVPAHKYKRAMSRLQGGKTQIAVTGGVAAVGGLAAAKANRKFHPVEERKVKKADFKGFLRSFKARPSNFERRPWQPNDLWRDVPPAPVVKPKQKHNAKRPKGQVRPGRKNLGPEWDRKNPARRVISGPPVSKSFGLARRAFMPRPVGIRAPRIRKPAIRRSYIARSASGKKFTVRGSLR